MNIIGTAKSKKQAKDNEKRKQIVVCPNCQHHFKVTQIQILFPIDRSKVIAEKDMSQSYENVSLQNSRQRTVDWKEIPITKIKQLHLIQSLQNNEFSTIQKLKKLNDLNQLKKSRMTAQKKNISTFSEVKLCSPQRQNLNERQQISPKQDFTPQKSNFPKQTGVEHRHIDSLSIIELSLQKNIIRQILNYLLQWIQTFGLGQTLPCFLKQMVQNYKFQNISQKHQKPSSKVY